MSHLLNKSTIYTSRNCDIYESRGGFDFPFFFDISRAQKEIIRPFDAYGVLLDVEIRVTYLFATSRLGPLLQCYIQLS